MKLKAILGKKERTVEVRREGRKLTAFIDGVEQNFEVSEPEKGTYLFKSDSKISETYVFRAAPDRPLNVTVNSEEFEIEIYDPKRLRGSSSGADSEKGPAKIRSAMPGKIVRVIARVGDKVQSGEGILVVEAMKMQNELKSPKDGVVKEILVKEDDRVNSGDVLAVVE